MTVGADASVAGAGLADGAAGALGIVRARAHAHTRRILIYHRLDLLARGDHVRVVLGEARAQIFKLGIGRVEALDERVASRRFDRIGVEIALLARGRKPERAKLIAALHRGDVVRLRLFEDGARGIETRLDTALAENVEVGDTVFVKALLGCTERRLEIRELILQRYGIAVLRDRLLEGGNQKQAYGARPLSFRRCGS